jgi:hypothetical protein
MRIGVIDKRNYPVENANRETGKRNHPAISIENANRRYENVGS